MATEYTFRSPSWALPPRVVAFRGREGISELHVFDVGVTPVILGPSCLFVISAWSRRASWRTRCAQPHRQRDVQAGVEDALACLPRHGQAIGCISRAAS